MSSNKSIKSLSKRILPTEKRDVSLSADVLHFLLIFYPAEMMALASSERLILINAQQLLHNKLETSEQEKTLLCVVNYKISCADPVSLLPKHLDF